MSCKLYVGGLAWSTDDRSLRTKFEEYGTVEDALVMRDRETGRSRGFAFVTYSNEQSAKAAIEALDDQDFEGRQIKVSKAVDRSSGGGGY